MDTTKAAVAGASVTVADAARGTSVTSVTGSDGLFQATYLLPGSYRVTVEITGFKKYVQDGVQLQMTETRDLVITLEVGGIEDAVNVVAEGASPKDGTMQTVEGELDSFGHVRLGGIGDRLAGEIEKRTGKEARAVVLGHVQRGGTPTAFDRWLATRFGLHAIAAVADGDFGKMVALRGTDIVRVPLIEGTGELKVVDPSQYSEAEVLFG